MIFFQLLVDGVLQSNEGTLVIAICDLDIFLISVNMILTLTVPFVKPWYVVSYLLNLSHKLPIHNALCSELYNDFFQLLVDGVLQSNEGTLVIAICDLDIFLISVNVILTLTVPFDKPWYVVSYLLDLSHKLPIYSALCSELDKGLFQLVVGCALQINESTLVTDICDLVVLTLACILDIRL